MTVAAPTWEDERIRLRREFGILARHGEADQGCPTVTLYAPRRDGPNVLVCSHVGQAHEEHPAVGLRAAVNAENIMRERVAFLGKANRQCTTEFSIDCVCDEFLHINSGKGTVVTQFRPLAWHPKGRDEEGLRGFSWPEADVREADREPGQPAAIERWAMVVCELINPETGEVLASGIGSDAADAASALYCDELGKYRKTGASRWKFPACDSLEQDHE